MKMKCYFENRFCSAGPDRRCAKGGFSLVETLAALAILALVSSSVFLVIERSVNSAGDMQLQMQAFEVARENMESLLCLTSVEEKTEYGISKRYPAISWRTMVEPFYEPINSQMWIQAICLAEYVDLSGRQQTVELKHWLTNLTKDDMIEIVKQRQEQKELTDRIIETSEDAAVYAGVDVEQIEQWVANGMEKTEDGYYTKGQLDLYKQSNGNPTEEQKIQQAELDAALFAAIQAFRIGGESEVSDDESGQQPGEQQPGEQQPGEQQPESEPPPREEEPERTYCGYTTTELYEFHRTDPAGFWKFMWSCEDF